MSAVESRFHLPNDRPESLKACTYLAWLAYHSRDLGPSAPARGIESSYRHLQQMLGFAGQRPIATLLSELVSSSAEGPWIEISQHHSAGRGTFYRPSDRTLRHIEDWERVGEALFGPEGALRVTLWGPALINSCGGLGLRKSIVLGLVATVGPLTPKEIHKHLSTYCTERTIRNAIRTLESYELLKREASSGALSCDLEFLEKYLTGIGARERKDQIDALIDRQQAAYQERTLGHQTLRNRKAQVRSLRCLTCGAHAHRRNEVDHYPPQKLGGTDETSQFLPICRDCHSYQGALKYWDSGPERQEVFTIVAPGTPEELFDMLEHLMVCSYPNFHAMVRTKPSLEVDESRNDAAKDPLTLPDNLFSMYSALCTGVNVVNSLTGEIIYFSANAVGRPLVDYVEIYGALQTGNELKSASENIDRRMDRKAVRLSGPSRTHKRPHASPVDHEARDCDHRTHLHRPHPPPFEDRMSSPATSLPSAHALLPA